MTRNGEPLLSTTVKPPRIAVKSATYGVPGDPKRTRDVRDRVPLVVDANGRIVWVVGVAIAEGCRVTTPESGVVILELKKGNQ